MPLLRSLTAALLLCLPQHRTNELLRMYSQQQAKDATAVRDAEEEEGNGEEQNGAAFATTVRAEKGEEKEEEANDEEDPALMDEVAKRLGN